MAGGSWRGFGGGLLVGAVGFAGTTALYFPALQHLPAAIASFLLYLAPVFIALLSWAFLRERLTRRILLGLALALGGLVLMASGAATGGLSLLGVLLALGSALTYSFTVLGGRHLTGSIAWSRAALGTCFGALLSYLVFTALTGTLRVPSSTPGLAYALGIGVLATVVPLSLFYAALPRIGASRTSLVLTLEPVSTLVLAAVFLTEIPAWTGVVGGLLIVGAAAMVSMGEPASAG
jgi:drug/metabolite transporter (DMT)-like permease